MAQSLLSQAEQLLRASGGRMTAQRRLVLQTLDGLNARGSHPNAEQVYEAVRSRQPIHPSTVYRTLGWLAQVGLVSSAYLDPGSGDRCEHFESALPQEHHHFVCEECGQVTEFASTLTESIRSRFAKEYGATVVRISLTLHGVCEQCLHSLGSNAKAGNRVTDVGGADLARPAAGRAAVGPVVP